MTIMKKLVLLILSFGFHTLFSQVRELEDPTRTNNSQTMSFIPLSFIDNEFSLSKHISPSKEQIKKSWSAKAWRNEVIHTQLAFAPNLPKDEAVIVRLKVSPLKSNKGNITIENIKFTPITFVMTDHPGNLKNGCSINVVLDSSLVADRIESTSSFRHNQGETRPLWLSIHVPKDVSAGHYSGKIFAEVQQGKTKKTYAIPYDIEVSDRVLPDPTDWNFHLDLWQNPYSSARYFNVKPLSEEHLKLMKPHYQMLADAGQKAITTTLIDDPWNGQTYDKYESMIKWTKTKDGAWKYDYSNFDKWVNYMHGLGIKKFINCYSMIPWHLSFYYFDEASGTRQVLQAAPGSIEYEQHWLPFLKDFAQHLRKNNWLEKTMIAMDERPMDAMIAAIKVIKKADKDFNISLAGSYHEELSTELLDYCIALNEDMPQDILNKRKQKGFTTTMYTCCTEIFPNTFTNSGYNEAVWLGWNTVERGFDGYLRWAFDCWNENPNQDTRYGKWLGGDTYFIYPNNISSIRFEKLKEGIRDAEKLRLIYKELLEKGDVKNLEELKSHVRKFSNKNIDRESITINLKKAKTFLNSL